MVPAHSHKVSRVSWYSGSCLPPSAFGYGPLTLSGGPFQGLLLTSSVLLAVRTPGCTHPGLGSSAFARRYLRNRCFFLFLRLLRCFSSPGSPPYVMDWRMDTCSLCMWVSPFRNLRVTGYLLLTAAYRSLSRLSSALSAKASTLRSFLLDLVKHPFAIALATRASLLLAQPHFWVLPYTFRYNTVVCCISRMS